MNKSDILITDCSGIAPEFLFTYKRPIIYFDKYSKIHNDNFDAIFGKKEEKKEEVKDGKPDRDENNKDRK